MCTVEVWVWTHTMTVPIDARGRMYVQCACGWVSLWSHKQVDIDAWAYEHERRSDRWTTALVVADPERLLGVQ